MPSGKGSYDDSFLFPSTKKDRLREFQRDACYDVLHAFKAESYELSQEKAGIMNDLIRYWNISLETLNVFESRLKHEPLVFYSRKEREHQKLVAILKKSNSEEPYWPSWGDVCPESLVNKWINIRLPDEDEYTAYQIKEYKEEEDMHHLVAAYSPTDYEDPFFLEKVKPLISNSLQFTAEEVIWPEENPGLTIQKRVRKQRFPKPERTLLQKVLLRQAQEAEDKAADDEDDDEDDDEADDEATYGGMQTASTDSLAMLNPSVTDTISQ